MTDDLTGVLDDATYNGNAAASTGTVSFTSPALTWTGSLAPGGLSRPRAVGGRQARGARRGHAESLAKTPLEPTAQPPRRFFSRFASRPPSRSDSPVRR